MAGSDDLGMAPEIVVDLESKVLDLNVGPISTKRGSDNDILPLPAMAAWLLPPCRSHQRPTTELLSLWLAPSMSHPYCRILT